MFLYHASLRGPARDTPSNNKTGLTEEQNESDSWKQWSCAKYFADNFKQKRFPRNSYSKSFARFPIKTSLVKYIFRKVAGGQKSHFVDIFTAIPLFYVLPLPYISAYGGWKSLFTSFEYASNIAVFTFFTLKDCLWFTSRFLKVALQILWFNFVLCLRRLNLFEHNIIICDPEGKACWGVWKRIYLCLSLSTCCRTS